MTVRLLVLLCVQYFGTDLLFAQNLTLVPSNVTADEGVVVFLTCVSTGNVSFTWNRFDNGNISILDPSTDSHLLVTDTPIVADHITYTSSLLEFCSVSPSDSSEYSCTAIDEKGAVKDTAMFSLTVLHVLTTAELVFVPKNTSIAAKSTVLMSCVSYGEKTNITWRKDDMELTKSTRLLISIENEVGLFTTSILEICDAGFSDAGMYSCTASNEDGNETFHFSLDIDEPAQITVPPDSYSVLTVVRGTNISITCAAHGDLPMNISWVQESTYTNLVTSNNSRVTVHEELLTDKRGLFTQSILELANVEKMDESKYICVAVNEFGNDSAVIELSVIPEGTSDDQTSDSTIIITTTSVGVALAVITCLVVAGLLVTLRRKCGHKHWSADALQDVIPLSSANAGLHTRPTTTRYYARSSLSDGKEETGPIMTTQSSLMSLTRAKTRKIPGRYIELMDTLGKGEFGVVYRAHLTGWSDKAKGDIVAVKTLRGSMFGPRDIEEMVEESNRMAAFNHPNVLTLIGVCIDVGEAPYIVMPFMANGSLLSHLRQERQNFTIAEGADIEMIEESQKCLLSMCLQIAKGMEYLASQNFVHRDLAARNCMIDADFIIKVADFGLSENLYSRNYFKQSNGEGDTKLPIKWMAIESLHDGVFSEKSDVWSFGVTCWEVFSLGRSPYPGVDPFTLLKYLETGERLQKPSNAACSDAIYDVMMQCWKDNPSNRPTFKSFVQQLSTLLDGLADYLDLSNLSIRKDSLFPS